MSSQSSPSLSSPSPLDPLVSHYHRSLLLFSSVCPSLAQHFSNLFHSALSPEFPFPCLSPHFCSNCRSLILFPISVSYSLNFVSGHFIRHCKTCDFKEKIKFPKKNLKNKRKFSGEQQEEEEEEKQKAEEISVEFRPSGGREERKLAKIKFDESVKKQVIQVNYKTEKKTKENEKNQSKKENEKSASKEQIHEAPPSDAQRSFSFAHPNKQTQLTKIKPPATGLYGLFQAFKK
jgi:hypothetical protein